jgi:FKBP-type peptidyl-prolyl cis-trans isomerase
MASRGEQIFAWVGVLVVVISTAALSGAVIIQQIIANRSSANTADTASSLACADNLTEPTIDTPAKYTVSSPVTKLQATDITNGSGNAAKSGDCLIVKYYGALATNGTMFDENYNSTKGFAFTLGQGQVIKGWDEGLVGMKSGGIRRLVIPADLAYGSQSNGTIPANSSLVFYVKLLRIQ